MTEIEVLGQLETLLASLDVPARQRVLDWAQAKYGLPKNWTLQGVPHIYPVASPVLPVPFDPGGSCGTTITWTAADTVGCNPGIGAVTTFWSGETSGNLSWTSLNPFS